MLSLNGTGHDRDRYLRILTKFSVQVHGSPHRRPPELRFRCSPEDGSADGNCGAKTELAREHRSLKAHSVRIATVLEFDAEANAKRSADGEENRFGRWEVGRIGAFDEILQAIAHAILRIRSLHIMWLIVRILRVLVDDKAC